MYSSKLFRTIDVVESEFKIDFFFATDDPFDRAQWARRQQVRLLDHDVFLTTAEDVIVMKLKWQRKKDIVDANYVLGVQGESLDWPYIEHWCEVHGTRGVLDDLRKQLPPNL